MKIKNESEFAAAINDYGMLLDQIAALASESKLVKAALELYANENRVNAYKTDRYRFKMSRGAVALRCRSGITDAAVVALLKSSETMRLFVSETFDADAIKAHAASLKDPDEFLEGFGLYLTQPARHAKVSSL